MAKFPTYEEMGKKVAEEALDEFLYDGKSIREWMQIIASKDAISRQAVLDVTWEEPSYTDALNVLTEVRDKVKALPPVNPQKPCEDAISRKEAISIAGIATLSVNQVVAALKKLPSVSSSEKPRLIDPAYEKTLNKWIGAEVLDRIRNEMHATAEKHEDGVYYLRDEWVDEIIDKHKAEGSGEE